MTGLGSVRAIPAGLNAEHIAVPARARAYGIIAGVLTLAILYFMIVKPALWSAG